MLNELQNLRVFDRITFFSKTHTYQIDGGAAGEVSVTGLLNRYKEPFDKDKWSKIKADKEGVEVSEIIDRWNSENLYSTTLGTIVHNFIDNYYNNKIVSHDKDVIKKELGEEKYLKLIDHIPELIKQFYCFARDHTHLLPIKNEFVVGDIDDTKICGMLDMLVYNTKLKQFEILDFKTNKNITHYSPFKNKMRYPVEHLDMCEVNTYSLQLSLYKYFLEKYAGIAIGACKVIWFNTKNDNYKVITLNKLDEEVYLILNDYSASKE